MRQVGFVAGELYQHQPKPLTMRLIIIVLALCSSVTRAFSQNDYFANDPVWFIRSTCAVLLPCIEHKEFNYYIQGDTLIGNQLYRKLYTRGSGSYQWMAQPPAMNCSGTFSFNDVNHPVGFVRDEGNVIWYATPGAPEEVLYDYNLEVGDFLPLTLTNFHSGIQVESIESILIGDQSRRKFNLSANSGVAYLIEGLGHDYGFIEAIPPILECGHELLCYGWADQSWYPEAGESCQLDMSVRESNALPADLRVVPNPSGGRFSVRLPQHFDASEVRICGPTGAIAQVATRLRDDNLSIDLDGYQPGIYLLVIHSDKGTFLSTRLILE
jgi:hypothetical protein